MTRKSWNVYMTLRLDQRSHGKAERSWIETASPDIVFTLGFNLMFSTLGTGWHEFHISWVANQRLPGGLDPVWIGLDRPRIGPTFLCMLQLGCSVTKQGGQGGQAASGQLGCFPAWPYNSVSLAVWQLWQLGCATVAAWLLDCLTAW